MSSSKGTVQALHLLRRLPRLTLSNIPVIPGANINARRKRGIHGGKQHGCGRKGPKHHQRHCPVGFEGPQSPFIVKFPLQRWAKERFDISYVPLSLQKLQLLIDTSRLDPSIPVDITQLYNTGVLRIDSRLEHGGIMLEEEGLDCFCTPMNLEVQYASEAAIAAVERAGGTITTAYYDPYSLSAALRPKNFFQQGLVIPRRLLPPQRQLHYYLDPRNRGYLSDPDKIAEERLALSQKYGYPLVDLNASPICDVLLQRKDPRQVFYGLQPGWLVNLADKHIVKPAEPKLLEYYAS